MSEIGDINEIGQGLRGYILSQKPHEAQVYREFWTLNECTYEAYRKYTRHVKEFGFPDHQKQEEQQRQISNLNTSHHGSISSDTSMLMRTVSWRSQGPLFTFRGMRAVIDDCKSPISVLKFGRLSSSLLAWGSQEGDVFFVDLEKEHIEDFLDSKMDGIIDKDFVPNSGVNKTIKKLRNNIISNVLDSAAKKVAQMTIQEHEDNDDNINEFNDYMEREEHHGNDQIFTNHFHNSNNNNNFTKQVSQTIVLESKKYDASIQNSENCSNQQQQQITATKHENSIKNSEIFNQETIETDDTYANSSNQTLNNGHCNYDSTSGNNPFQKSRSISTKNTDNNVQDGNNTSNPFIQINDECRNSSSSFSSSSRSNPYEQSNQIGNNNKNVSEDNIGENNPFVVPDQTTKNTSTESDNIFGKNSPFKMLNQSVNGRYNIIGEGNNNKNNPFKFTIKSNKITSKNPFELPNQTDEISSNEIDNSVTNNNPFKLRDKFDIDNQGNNINKINPLEFSNQMLVREYKHNNNNNNNNSHNNDDNVNDFRQSNQVTTNQQTEGNTTQVRVTKKVEFHDSQPNNGQINTSKSAPIRSLQENEKRMNINLDINKLHLHNRKNSQSNTALPTTNVVQIPQTMQLPKQHEKCVMDLDWSQDNQFVLTASQDSKLCLWDLNSKKCVRIITSKIQLFCCRFHQMNQNILLCGGSGGTIEAYNSSTGTLVQKADVRMSYNMHENIIITSMACSNTCLYIGDSVGNLYMLQCEIRNGKLWPLMFISRTPYPKIKNSEIIRIIYQGYSAFVHGPSLLCSVIDGTVLVYRVYDTVGKLELVQQVQLPAMARRIFSSWCPTPTLDDPEYVVTGGEDTTVKIYDIKSHGDSNCVVNKNQLIEINKLQGHSSPVVDVCWSYDEQSLASGDCNGMVIVWRRKQQESGLSSRRISQGSLG